VGHAALHTFGPYVVERQLGLGGMASVHLAQEPRRDGSVRKVALKRLFPNLIFNRELVASFVHEGRVMRYLKHPNIPETYASGKLEGTYYIAMEYAPGPTLKELVTHCGETVGTIPVAIALRIGHQLCAALDHAHTARNSEGQPLGIIHRDVSPANIILSDGLVKLIDFGLAKAAMQPSETDVGVIKGKYAYIAPEYLDGSLDARADLWAVGVVMYELLTSRRLFGAPDAFETTTRVRRMPIPRPSIANPRVPPKFDELVMRALERDPARRWQTAAEMRDALQAGIAQAAQGVDGRHVAEWVRWVFTQKPGTDSTGVHELMAMVRPSTPPPIPVPGAGSGGVPRAASPPVPQAYGIGMSSGTHQLGSGPASGPVPGTAPAPNATRTVRVPAAAVRARWEALPEQVRRVVLLVAAFVVSAFVVWRLMA